MQWAACRTVSNSWRPRNSCQRGPTQQIAADITQMPEEWKKLDGRAVNRLMETMEDGLAAAVDSLDAQEQEHQKDAELAQEIVGSDFGAGR